MNPERQEGGEHKGVTASNETGAVGQGKPGIMPPSLDSIEQQEVVRNGVVLLLVRGLSLKANQDNLTTFFLLFGF